MIGGRAVPALMLGRVLIVIQGYVEIESNRIGREYAKETLFDQG